MRYRPFITAIASLALVSSAAVASAQTHTLVSVGDHRLDVVRSGAGGPAVVFETGLADSLDVWLVAMAIRFVLDRVRAQ